MSDHHHPIGGRPGGEPYRSQHPDARTPQASGWPRQEEPIRFASAPPPQPREDNPVLGWVLRGAGLLMIAVISGLVWWYVQQDSTPDAKSPPDTTAPQSAGVYAFTPHEQVREPRKDTDCAANSYGKIREFFTQTACRQLTRGLYTTATKDGRRVYTSVAVVRMANAEDAAKLRELTDTDGTGNVNDLLRAKVVTVSGLEALSGGGGYSATQHGDDVIIVESDFGPADKRDKDADEKELDAICSDAIRLGDDLSAAGR